MDKATKFNIAIIEVLKRELGLKEDFFIERAKIEIIPLFSNIEIKGHLINTKDDEEKQ